MKLSITSAFALCIRLGFTSPISLPNLQQRDSVGITAAQLANFKLFAQYSTAAYCTNVVDNPNTTLIACAANGGNCSLVEQSKGFLVDSFFHLGSQDTTGYVAVDPTNKLIVVAFQGTSGLDNPASLLDDVEITRDKTDICGTANTNDGCEIHHGFLDSWNDAEPNVSAALNSTVLAYPDHKIIFTGHSLGAAIAAIGAAVTRNSGKVVDLYTYGQPRIGSQDISTYITNQSPTLGNNYRTTDFNDEVPQLPPHSVFLGEDWDHISPEYWISLNGTDILPTDIHVITTPLFSTAGNSGFSLANSSITAHREYFGHISACD